MPKEAIVHVTGSPPREHVVKLPMEEWLVSPETAAVALHCDLEAGQQGISGGPEIVPLTSVRVGGSVFMVHSVIRIEFR